MKTMYIIISHDVDHLFGKDHWFRDFIYIKLFIRSSLQFIQRKITIKEWYLRIISCFRRERHKLYDLMSFDRKYDVESTFFFGMEQGLGMSYTPKEAKELMKEVCKNGFEVGVHGIAYNNQGGMKKEYERFKDVIGFYPNGIRMHYVRFDEETFENLSVTGYRYDSTEFNKTECGTIKNPYKVGNMWEFPLTVMDGYLPQNKDEAIKKTMEILDRCYECNMEYVSILFHDYQFCEDYKAMYEWYKWLIRYVFDDERFSFISYMKAIDMLEKREK